jgi:hypothetical protein
LTLQSSTSNANLGASVTFTATVQSIFGGTITGEVQFLNGSTVLGSAPVTGGVAIYSTSSLPAGTSTITAIYSGDANFAGSSNTINQLVTAPAYSITATPGSLSLAAGQTGHINLTVTPVGGFTGTVVLGCTGLPNWVSCQSSPQVVQADGSNTPITATLTIVSLGPNTGTVNNVSKNDGSPLGGGSGPTMASIFFLPGLLLGGFVAWERKKLNANWKCMLMLVLLVSTMSGMVGCGFSRPNAPNGSYTVTIHGAASNTSSLYTGPSSETVNVTLTITK